MNKAVIFDLDGTLIHSLPDIAENVNITLEKFGAKKRDEREIRQLIGGGARNLIDMSFGGGLTEEELNQRLGFYNTLYTGSGSPKTQVFDGMKTVIKELKNRGYKLAVLTNKPQATTDNVCDRLLADCEFDQIVGFRAGAKTKPDPTALLDILSALSVDHKDAYFVGDGETDVQVAINAKVNGVAVLWGYRDKNQLESVGAKVFVEKPAELLEVLI